jgi:adenylate cyclase
MMAVTFAAAGGHGQSCTPITVALSAVKRFLSLLNRGTVYWVPLVVLFAAAAAHLAIPSVFERLSLLSFDTYQRAAPRQAASDLPIRIVDIDDKSLKQIGQWPWSRSVIADLLDKLREAGASVVVFDVIFAEPDRTSPKLLLPLLTDMGVDGGDAKQLLAKMADPDDRLAEAMSKLPVVVGFALSDGTGTGTPMAKAGFSSAGAAGSNPLRYVRSFPEAVAALPMFQKAAAGNGFDNELPDEWDDVVRHVPLLLRLADKAVPSLAAEALRLGTGAHGYIAKGAGANGQQSFGENTGLNSVKIGPLIVPTDGAGRVWAHFARADANRFVSAVDIVSGNFDRSRIADNIVLIGASYAGLNDLHATPVDPKMPGVEIQAQLIEQVLQGDFLDRPDWVGGAEILFTMLIGIVLILAIPRFGALLSAAIVGVAVIAVAAASWFAFRDAHLLVDPVYPIVVIGIIYLLGTILSYRSTEQRQREIRQAFSRYMSPYMVEELAAHPEKLVLGGQIKLITIMFCDIRGFTTLSEGLTAAELGQLINNFLTPMTEIIMANKGTIDKYIGDCIMAFWNAPLDDPDHAKNAVAAALAMREKLIELNDGWRAQGKREIHIGIGINTGECCVGNFGSEQRFDYSLLGDPVNLSSRLESLTKQYHVDFIIGEDSAELLDEPNLIELDLVAVKGKSRAVRIYTLPPHPVETEQYLARHQELLAAYRRRDWEGALALLEDRTLAGEPDMAPFYELFRERIAQLQIESLPEDWDGVYVAHEK